MGATRELTAEELIQRRDELLALGVLERVGQLNHLIEERSKKRYDPRFLQPEEGTPYPPGGSAAEEMTQRSTDWSRVVDPGMMRRSFDALTPAMRRIWIDDMSRVLMEMAGK